MMLRHIHSVIHLCMCTCTHTHTRTHTHTHTHIHTHTHTHTHTHLYTCSAKHFTQSLPYVTCYTCQLPSKSYVFTFIPDIQEFIASVVSPKLYQRYTTLNLQQFVSEYRGVKWCPHPGCGQAVTTPEQQSAERRKKENAGLNVWCGKGHAFCWYPSLLQFSYFSNNVCFVLLITHTHTCTHTHTHARTLTHTHTHTHTHATKRTCNQEAHEPCGCALWRKWKEVVMEMTAGGRV